MRTLNTARSIFFCLASVGLSACGGDDGGDDTPVIGVDTYLGTWRTTSGSIDLTCDGQQVSLPTTGESMLVERGAGSDLRIPEDEGCPDRLLDVIDGEARLAAPITCTETDEDGTFELTLQSYTLAASNAQRATESGQGTATATIDGTDIACTFSVSGELEKL